MFGDGEPRLDPDRVAIGLLARCLRQLTTIVAKLNLQHSGAARNLTFEQRQIDEELLDVLTSLTRVADHFLAPTAPTQPKTSSVPRSRTVSASDPLEAPRANVHRSELERKRALLHEPHIAPLTALVERLRRQRSQPVPWFDPTEAGTSARILLLLETPGRFADAVNGSGFVSPDNNDASAETTWRLLREVGINRQDVVTWNIVPWYLGDENRIATVRMRDLDEARPALAELLALLPDLRVVVLLGRKAQHGWQRAGLRPDLLTISAPHASQRSMIRAGARESLRAALAKAARQSRRMPE